MAFLDFIKSGLDTDYLFLPAGAADTAKEVATAQEKLVQAQYQKGLVDETEFQSRMQEISGSTTFDALFSEPGNSPTSAFGEGLKEGFQKLPDTINRTLGGTVSGIFRSIPWNVWILLLLALGIWLVIQLNLIQRFAFRAR